MLGVGFGGGDVMWMEVVVWVGFSRWGEGLVCLDFFILVLDAFLEDGTVERTGVGECSVGIVGEVVEGTNRRVVWGEWGGIEGFVIVREALGNVSEDFVGEGRGHVKTVDTSFSRFEHGVDCEVGCGGGGEDGGPDAATDGDDRGGLVGGIGGVGRSDWD